MTKERVLILLAFLFLGLTGLLIGMNVDSWSRTIQEKSQAKKQEEDKALLKDLAGKVLPVEGFSLPISWGDIGPELIKRGVIDEDKFAAAIDMSDEEKKVLEGTDAPISINSSNGQFVVDMLWAFGLAQRSVVYDQGPMGQEYKADVGNFASTGGWTLAKGDAVEYLGKFDLIGLDVEEQTRVADIVRNIYRPCCGNSTWFPDCNHGMAALGAVELMVDKGLSDEEIYKEVLKLNSFWFPDAYLSTAVYFERQGISWDNIDAKEALSSDFSSAKGAADIAKKVGPLPTEEIVAGSCGA